MLVVWDGGFTASLLSGFLEGYSTVEGEELEGGRGCCRCVGV